MNDRPELCERFLARRLRPSTRATYAKHFRSLIASCGGQLVPDAEAIDAWVRSAPSQAYAEGRRTAAAALWRWAARRPDADPALRSWVRAAFGPVDVGDAPLVERARGARELPRVLTRAEMRSVLQEAERDTIDYAAVVTILDTGLRIGELASLTRDRIRPGELAVDAAVSKGHRARVVPASPATITALRALERPGLPLWPARPRNGGHWPAPVRPAKSLENRVRRVLARAGITPPKAGPHVLRHTFATWYIRRGGSVERLRLILGHSSIATTMIYVHLAGLDIADEHRRASPLGELLASRQLELPGETGAAIRAR